MRLIGNKLKEIKIIEKDGIRYLKLEIDNPLFNGFYGGTVFNPNEEGGGYAYSLNEGDDDELGGYIREQGLDYEYDVKEYEKGILEEVNNFFMEKVNDHINYVLDIEDFFVKKIGEQLTSPTEYNFRTDRAFLDVCVKEENYIKFIDYMFNEQYDELKAYIKEKHSSREGFISFYSSDIDTWKENNYDFDCNELESIFKTFLDLNTDKEEIFYDLVQLCSDTFYSVDYWYEDIEGNKYYYSDLLKIVEEIEKQEEEKAKKEEDFKKNQTTFD